MKHLLICLMLVGCGYRTASLPNGCLVNAIGKQDSINAQKRLEAYRWSRVIIVEWTVKGKSVAHAWTVFTYEGRLMAYDPAKGSWTLTRDLTAKESAIRLAELWAPNTAIKQAFFLEDKR